MLQLEVPGTTLTLQKSHPLSLPPWEEGRSSLATLVYVRWVRERRKADQPPAVMEGATTGGGAEQKLGEG